MLLQRGMPALPQRWRAGQLGRVLLCCGTCMPDTSYTSYILPYAAAAAVIYTCCSNINAFRFAAWAEEAISDEQMRLQHALCVVCWYMYYTAVCRTICSYFVWSFVHSGWRKLGVRRKVINFCEVCQSVSLHRPHAWWFVAATGEMSYALCFSIH